jgi:hypothetical protein
MVTLKYLHISKSILLQRHVISLDGPVVTASGFKDKLAVVTHASDRLSSNDQVGSAFAESVVSDTGTSSVVLFIVLLYTIRLQVPTNIQSFSLFSSYLVPPF